MRSTLPLSALFLAACAGWGNLPDQSQVDLDQPLWDPARAVASAYGVYVPLPHAGGLALIQPEGRAGKATRIDLGEGRLTRLFASPDGGAVVGFVERTWCEEGDERKPPERVDECPFDRRVDATEFTVIRDTETDEPVALEGFYNAIAWSTDGRYAIAYLDFSDPTLQLDGVVSLTSVVTLDLARNLVTPVSVGFAADTVLFVEDPTGAAQQAVVLSQSSVALVDLLPEVPERTVTFPLSLDPDTQVVPVGADLTPDGRYALISVAGRADLYALDLESRSINIVELSSVPSGLAVNPAVDRTVLVYGNGSMVDVLEHDLFDLESFTLDEPMTDVLSPEGATYAMLYNTANGHDAYRLDLQTNALTEYRLENPAISLSIAPTDEYAIALTRREGGIGGDPGSAQGLFDANPGMEILDLNDDETIPFLLEGKGLAVEWSATPTELKALVLQEGVDYVYQLDLYTGRSEELELIEPPVTIGTLPDGDFFITHPNPLGMITFLDPATGDTLEVGGFATLGLTDPIELIDPPKEAK